MNDKDLKMWVESMLQSGNNDFIDVYKTYQAFTASSATFGTPLSDILSDMEKIESDVQKNKYWDERRYKFLAWCCKKNITQSKIKVVTNDGDLLDFSEINFSIKDGWYTIQAFTTNGNMMDTIPSDGFTANHYELTPWVRLVMRKVYDNVMLTKKLKNEI